MTYSSIYIYKSASFTRKSIKKPAEPFLKRSLYGGWWDNNLTMSSSVFLHQSL